MPRRQRQVCAVAIGAAGEEDAKKNVHGDDKNCVATERTCEETRIVDEKSWSSFGKNYGASESSGGELDYHVGDIVGRYEPGRTRGGGGPADNCDRSVEEGFEEHGIDGNNGNAVDNTDDDRPKCWDLSDCCRKNSVTEGEESFINVSRICIE